MLTWPEIIQGCEAFLIDRIRNSDGTFRISDSAYHERSVDATSLAIDLAQMLGTKNLRIENAIKYLLSRQSEKYGFFTEEFESELDHSVPRISEMTNTYLSYQVVEILDHCNVTSQWPIFFFKQLHSDLECWQDYIINFMPWETTPMGAGNMIDHGVSIWRYNKKYHGQGKDEFLSKTYSTVNRIRSYSTGMWGNIDAQGLNGVIQATYHLMRGLHYKENIPISNALKVLDLIVLSIKQSEIMTADGGEGCHDMDHISLIWYLVSLDRSLLDSKLIEILLMRRESILKLWNSKGGFRFETSGSIKNHNRYNVTPGHNEADLVGTVFFLETLNNIEAILSGEGKVNPSCTHGKVS